MSDAQQKVTDRTAILTSALEQMEVGVVVERRQVASRWADVLWRPVAVLEEPPAASPWTPIAMTRAVSTFYAGPATIALHRAEADGYLDNLACSEPRLWVVLRAGGTPPGFGVQMVSADPATGEALTGCGNDIIETVPMPPAIAARLAEFVARHHVAQPQYRRAREGAKAREGSA